MHGPIIQQQEIKPTGNRENVRRPPPPQNRVTEISHVISPTNTSNGLSDKPARPRLGEIRFLAGSTSQPLLAPSKPVLSSRLGKAGLPHSLIGGFLPLVTAGGFNQDGSVCVCVCVCVCGRQRRSSPAARPPPLEGRKREGDPNRGGMSRRT
ncbi:hypothetical protein BDW42DRAFT_44880 [Aspergillus taichungensis]|uniref:Uncharacterized protein n=1 Tax=Aspergillus taichungensis TaxID=482145 RepID=A0A2J5I359_9EURO|nr:hypothetical protein BDW42DRAFT_44880 [Aspergillus taichungensis]